MQKTSKPRDPATISQIIEESIEASIKAGPQSWRAFEDTLTWRAQRILRGAS